MKLLNDYIDVCRLHRPIGIWLLLFPGLIGLSLSPKSVPVEYWGIFLIGAVVMRSAGCIINDIVDRPFDGSVNRTKARPLVRGNDPLSLRWALVFLAFNLTIGLLCLMQFNSTTILIGFMAAAMIGTYPWMKRITYWPQLFLGFTMNMGFVIGCAAVEICNLGAALIYVGMIFWTLGYDTIYGFQDIEDDATIGVKSTSLKFQSNATAFMWVSCAVTAAAWLGAGLAFDIGVAYYICIGAIIGLLVWQIRTLDIKSSLNCLIRFRINQWVGLLLWLGVLIGCKL